MSKTILFCVCKLQHWMVLIFPKSCSFEAGQPSGSESDSSGGCTALISIPPPLPRPSRSDEAAKHNGRESHSTDLRPQLLFLHHSSSDISTWRHPKITFFMDESKYSPVMLPIKSGIFPGESAGKWEF